MVVPAFACSRVACRAVAREASEGWWRRPVTLRPRRSCKDHLHSCAIPIVVPGSRYARDPPRFQRGASTKLASQANLARMPIIEIGSPEWRSGARPSSYIRNCCVGRATRSRRRSVVGNQGIEPCMRKGAGFTAPLSHQTWRYPKELARLRDAKPDIISPSSPVGLRRARFAFVLRGCATRSRRRNVVRSAGAAPAASAVSGRRSAADLRTRIVAA